MSDLLEQLDDLATDLRTHFDDINYGGCAVVAVMMYEKLKPILGRKVQIEYLIGGLCATDDAKDSIKRNVRVWKENSETLTNITMHREVGVYCCHAYIVFTYEGERYMFDTDYGVVTRQQAKRRSRHDYSRGMSVRMAFPIVKQMAESVEGWNSCFDRRQIEPMRQRIDSAVLVAE